MGQNISFKIQKKIVFQRNFGPQRIFFDNKRGGTTGDNVRLSGQKRFFTGSQTGYIHPQFPHFMKPCLQEPTQQRNKNFHGTHPSPALLT
jgi:hypothetical protein